MAADRRTSALHAFHAVLAVIAAMFRILVSLAPGRRATAARPAPAAAPAPASAAGRIPAQAPAPVPWRIIAPRLHVPRETALPPTIKQRITAEAHGSSPSVRRVCAPPPSAGEPAPAASPAPVASG